MESKINDTQTAKTITTIHHKNEIGLPLIALGLDLLPFLIIALLSIASRYVVQWIVPFVVLIIVFSPIIGIITGAASLSRGKERIGIAGMVIAIIAVSLPFSIIALIGVAMNGVGVISLM